MRSALFVLTVCGSVAFGVPAATAQVSSLPLPGLEGAYGGFAGATFETSFDFRQSFPGVASARLDVTGQTSLPFPVDVGFQTRLDGVFGPVQIEPQLFDFTVSVEVNVQDSAFDGRGTLGLGAFPQFCCDHQVMIHSATLRFEIEPFESLGVSAAALSWQPVSHAGAYDVVTGDLATLVASGGDFSAATAQCLAVDRTETNQPFEPVPEPGAGIWSLVRAGDGSYDSGATSQAGSRDPGIRQSPSSCP